MNKSLLVCFAIAVGASAVSIRLKQDPETLCLGQENFLRITAEDSCLRYYQCYAGRAYLMQCPMSTWFNELEQICDTSEPPAGCEVEGNPNSEPEPVLEETEEAEESEEDSPKDLEVEDGSGDLLPLGRHHKKNSGKEDKELEQGLLQLLTSFMIKTLQENEVQLTNAHRQEVERTLSDILQSYSYLKQLEINDETSDEFRDQIPEVQIEDSAEKEKKNKQVLEKDGSENYEQDIELEDEDLIKIIVNKLQNQQTHLLRRQRQSNDAGINEIEGNDSDEDQSTDDDEDEEPEAEEDDSDDDDDEQGTEGDGEDEPEPENPDDGEDENPDDSEDENPDDSEEGNPDDGDVGNPEDNEEVEETPEENADQENDDVTLLDILQESEINKEKARGFFKRFFRINV